MCKNLFFSLSLAVLLTAPAVLHAQQRAVSVSGFCYLEGQTDHSGSKVLFTAVSPSAVTDSVFTAFDGAFTAGLNEGIYTIEYSKTGYVTQTLPGTWSFFENDTLPDVTLLEGFSGTLEVSGPQSGVWESGYLVKAMGDLTVAAGDTLMIEPGVTVRFMGDYKMEVFGTLLAAGTEEDSIVFTSGQPFPAPDDWQFIYFRNATSSGSVVSYASIQYGQYGIYCYYSSPTIQQNRISYNNNEGIYCYYSSPTIQQNQISYNNYHGISCNSSSPTIQQNQISYNNVYGIYCEYSSPTIQQNQISYNNSNGISCSSSSPTIQQNQINNNYRGINCSWDSSPTIQQNQISYNNGEGIYCSSSSPTIRNNIVQNNGSGVYITGNSNPAVLNNILVGNSFGVKLYSPPSTLSYNLFWDNTTLYSGIAVPAAFGEMVTQNANGDPCDTYFNLFMDPEFAFSGQYTFEACTNLAGDENPDNDCTVKIVNNLDYGTKKQEFSFHKDITHTKDPAVENDFFYQKNNEQILFENNQIERAPGTVPGKEIVLSDADYDLQFEFACGDATGEAGIETDGDYIYTTKWNGTGFFRYELDGTFLGAFQVGSVNGIRDLAYDGTYFYGGAAATTVYKMDFGTNTLIGQFTAPIAVRAIGYDEGENGFWANNWSTTITLFDEAGAVMSTIPTNGDESFYGFAYDFNGPYLWGYSQRTGSSQNILYKYALPDGTFLEEFDVFPLLSMPAAGDVAGGLAFHQGIVPGYWTILGIVQDACIWGMEMGYYGTQNYDLSILSIVSPNSGNALGTESVVIKIKNFGEVAVSDIPWTVTWSGQGSGSLSGTYAGPLAGKSEVDITVGTADLSALGIYNFEACVNLVNDPNPDNNCRTKAVENAESSLCIDNLYSSGCSSGDGLIAWDLANINVPDIPCAGTPPWYHDYTDMVHELEPGQTYVVTATAGYSSTYFDVWIDFDGNLELNNYNELVLNDAVCETGSTPYTFDITIPADAPNGEFVLRFRTNWTAAVTDPCATYSYGNAADFRVNISSNFFSHDVGISSIIDPSNGNLSNSEQITIRMFNYGLEPAVNIPYEVNWTGGLYSGSYSGIYEDTLNSKEYVDITLPVTVDFTLVDYSLLPTSPCIDAGDPDPAYYDPDGTIGDIGAFYYDQGSAAPVISDFTADPVSGRQPLVVQFSQEITGPVTSYLWSFSDGSTSTLPNPVKVFTEMGKVSVSLLVEGPGGQDILVKNDYITVLAPLPPLNPLFTATPLLGYAPLEVQFTNQSTGPWQTLLWDFGDGNTSTALNPLHTYQQPGEYTVTLSISTGTSSKMLVKENYIHAIEPMEVVAQFTTSGSYGAAPYTVAFFNGSFGSVDSLLWDFGDGNVSVVANPMNTYGLPGIYTATLTAFGPLNSHTAAEMILVESASPVITQITDRPNDQGGYVYVHFKKSFWDQVTPERSTESYTIQRLDNGNWVSLSSVLAYGEPIYTAEAATPADSSATSLSLTDFRVIAGMDEGTWISEPAQGYSVDNIVPASPMVVDYTLSEDQITITWQPSTAPDFQHFNVYRSQESGSYGNTPAASLTGLTFTDNVGSSEAWFYTITAVDDAGNESMPSEEVSTLLSMQITLPQGWSGISGFLDVYDPAVSGIFSTLLDDLVILVGENGIFWPGQNINTIGNWQTNEGYQVKMTQPQVLELRGTGPLSRLIQLSAGWNLIPVLSDYPVEVETLFAGKDLIIIKEVAGWNLYWPAKGINTLDMLQPGRSYFVMMGSAGQLEFPD